ncbi:hypothetical protein U8P80_10110 [Rhizobium beringeri]|uniref:hypothetical protein n=1 Tax=Rhizobium ruizarguesonis TaxID=2081791 RepID=UPI0003698CDB|nr:hypothetical protein [Rhizobium ruizarguesonis]MCB2400069.1 hypothetical protein [Rhizobium ruizarguesonis]WSG75932.1 hypothetical protein U8P80_10110 [Rhizobium beringeri]WSH16127.1 hypothetical protein U8P74_10110 [Rhizobium beringeri]
MKIACLGWGSLVWDPRELPLRSEWLPDGPTIRVEFVRQSGKEFGRITLVIVPTAEPVVSKWAEMNSDDPDEVAEMLRLREGKPHRHHIGQWRVGQDDPSVLPGLSGWAGDRGVDAVIWTALPPKFHGEEGRIPSVEEVATYLNSLPEERRAEAVAYIRNAPVQIKTAYRRELAILVPATAL